MLETNALPKKIVIDKNGAKIASLKATNKC